MMERRTRWYSYVVVGLFSLVGLFVAAWLWGLKRDAPTALILLKDSAIGAVVYAAFGLLSGVLWPKVGWKWGLLLIAPLFLLLAFSLLFAGYVGAFLRRDLLVLLVSVAASCAAAHVGQRCVNQ